MIKQLATLSSEPPPPIEYDTELADEVVVPILKKFLIAYSGFKPAFSGHEPASAYPENKGEVLFYFTLPGYMLYSQWDTAALSKILTSKLNKELCSAIYKVTDERNNPCLITIIVRPYTNAKLRVSFCVRLPELLPAKTLNKEIQK
jgi:hypothetical protein